MEEKKKTTLGVEATLLIIVVIIITFRQTFLTYFKNFIVALGGSPSGLFNGFVSFSQHLLGVLVGISIPISVFLLIATIYSVEQLKIIRKKESLIYGEKIEQAYEPKPESGDALLSRRWENATRHISSDNPNDWKQAIIESDIMLDDILTTMGYQGETVGEKLKRVSVGDMKSLNEAWEAHKVRNQIAHEGSNFNLNEVDARRVFNMYKKVFEEFFYI